MRLGGTAPQWQTSEGREHFICRVPQTSLPGAFFLKSNTSLRLVISSNYDSESRATILLIPHPGIAKVLGDCRFRGQFVTRKLLA
jgi:hypothetical protein